MKVVLTNRSALPYHPPGGVEKYLFYFSRALFRQGVEVEVVVSRPPGEDRHREVDGILYTFLSPQVQWDRPFAPGPSVGNFLLSLNLARYLRSQRFDVLHAFNTLSYAYLHLKRRAVVVHQPFEEAYNYHLESVGRVTPLKRVALAAKKHIDRYILLHSDAVASEHEKQTKIFMSQFGVAADHVFALPVGVDLSSIDGALKTRQTSRGSLGLGSADFVLISVNRLVPHKGLNYLIDALPQICGAIPSAKLLLVGAGPQEEAIKDHIRDRGLSQQVIHLKNIPDAQLYGLYALSDVYISPTLENISILSVIEAMACSLPVVSTGQEFWVKDGVNGYVVPKRNPQAIAEAVMRIYREGTGQAFGQASRHIAQGYDFSVIVQMALTRYQELLAKRQWATVGHRGEALS